MRAGRDPNLSVISTRSRGAFQPDLVPLPGSGDRDLNRSWFGLERRVPESPDLPIDNNRTERSLRGWAVGRNNWTFFGSDRSGRTAAILRSFVASCELVKVEPFAWFRDVLSRVAAHPVTKLEQLLPHRWAQAPA
jgi:transposase